MNYVYYCPTANEIYITAYHYGMGTNLLFGAFDGVESKTRRSGIVLFQYLGKVD